MSTFGSDDSRGGGRRPGAGGGFPGQGAGQARPGGRLGSAAAQHGTGLRAQLPGVRPGADGQGVPVTPELRRPAAQAPTPVEAPTPTLPTGGGAIRSIAEKFSANPATGTGGTAIPIAVSPGRGGFGPELTVGYDSGAGNGPFGLGWSLSVPSISRKTDKGLPQYRDDRDSDTFVMSGAEDLVPFLVEQGGTWVRDIVTVGSERRERFRRASRARSPASSASPTPPPAASSGAPPPKTTSPAPTARAPARASRIRPTPIASFAGSSSAPKTTRATSSSTRTRPKIARASR